MILLLKEFQAVRGISEKSVVQRTQSLLQNEALYFICYNYLFSTLYSSRANEVLQAETQMFEKYMKRIEPIKDLIGAQAAAQPPVSSTPSHSTHDLLGGRVGRKRSKSRSSTTDRMLRLSAEQKCDIAQREIEEYKEEIDKLRDDSEKVLDNFKVSNLIT